MGVKLTSSYDSLAEEFTARVRVDADVPHYHFLDALNDFMGDLQRIYDAACEQDLDYCNAGLWEVFRDSKGHLTVSFIKKDK